MKLRLFLIASLLGFLTGCLPATQSPIPTPYPPDYLPTVIALTAEAANAVASQTAVAVLPTGSPTDTPEPTFTPKPNATFTATAIPGHDSAAIQILSPGPMSKVVSPILLKMNIVSGESQKAQIDLFAEDGTLLSRTLKKVPLSSDGVFQQIKIPFEIRAAAEVARITITTTDKAGRIQALNSVRVLLLSSGDNEITPPGNPSEPVGVFRPTSKDEASGGVLNVRVDVWPFNLNPVMLELIGPDQKSLGLRILTINQLNPQLFETTVPYKVSEPTLARLTIRQDDDRMSGVFYVYSQEILLNP
ncbi:MAG: hypothetical protein ACM3Y8_07080 [Byssovorax cruenta]